MKRTVLTIGTVAVVTLGSAFATNAPAVHAETSLQDVKDQQDEVKSKLSKAESKIADVLFEIKDINAEMDRLDAALKENKEQITKNEKKMDKLQEEIDGLNEKIEKRNDILKDRISSYQDNGGNLSYLEVFLGSRDFNEFVSRLSAVTSITNADSELIEENEKDKEEVEKKLEKQEKVAQELDDQKETIDSQKEQKKESKADLKDKEAKVKDEKSKLESKSSDLQSVEDDIRASMETPSTPEVASQTTSNESSDSSNNNSNASSKKSDSGSSPVAYTGAGGSAIAAGKQFIGKTTYSWGKQSPEAGLFDCSGFVQWAYKQEGIDLPRATGGQGSAGTKVSYSDAKPGDLVMFRGGSHVGIYLGGGKFLGSQTSTGVAIADMNSGYWKDHFDGNVRRIK